MKPFNEQLMQARRIKGLTQDQLAAEMNITRQGISRWENGRTMPDIETLKRLSEVLSYNFMAAEAFPAQASDMPDAAQIYGELHVAALTSDKSPDAEQVNCEPPAAPAPLAPAPRRNFAFVMCALCLMIGLAAGCLMGSYLFPHTAHGNALPPSSGEAVTPSHASYVPEVAGEAFVRIAATEDPVKAIRMSDNSAAWRYTAIVRNVGELSFIVDKAEIYVITDDGASVLSASLTAPEMGWGDGELLPGCEFSVRGGFPVQAFKSVHLIVTGADIHGKASSFEGDIFLSNEFAE